MNQHTQRMKKGFKGACWLVAVFILGVGSVGLAVVKPWFGVPLVLLQVIYLIGWAEENDENYQGW